MKEIIKSKIRTILERYYCDWITMDEALLEIDKVIDKLNNVYVRRYSRNN